MGSWDERYRQGEAVSLEPSQLLVKWIKELQPGRVLDVACGAGRHSIYLATFGWRVTAVDASKEGIAITERRALELGLEIDARVADLERFEFVIAPEAYDLICIFYYLQHDLFPQIRAGVTAGGSVIAAIHLRGDGPKSNPVFALHPGELKKEFDGWSIVDYQEGQPRDTEHKRQTAEIIAIKPKV